MPFRRTRGGKYRSPSGRTFTARQVKLYYSLGGRFPGQRKKHKRKK